LAKKKLKAKSANGYSQQKRRAARAQAEQSRAGRDLGALPGAADPARRARCDRSLLTFGRTYHAEKFALPCSDDHLAAIARFEDAVLGRALFAFAMPRGSGKSTWCQVGCEWAACYGHRRFIVWIHADLDQAAGGLDELKCDFEQNDLLCADFPEVCLPIRALEGVANRCKGQLSQGQRTLMVWGSHRIVLPTIAGSAASGCRIIGRGILSRIRGMKVTLPDGSILRPDLVIVDDPQTEASARSAAQVTKRMKVLTGAILGLAGPGKTISGIMPCTVIEPGDVADQILDRAHYPQWQGLRTKLVYAWPADIKLWERYADIRADSQRDGHGGREATEFYAANREAMDAGAKVAWESRKNPEDLSALQHAINLRLDLGDAAFSAEYQNDPQKAASDVEELTPDQIGAKANGLPRGILPNNATDLTGFIDVNQKLLYWTLVAWRRDFTGHVVDYRGFPDPERSYYRMAEASRTLARRYPRAGLEGSIHAGLDELVNLLGSGEWPREDGAPQRISRILIDYGWGQTADTVLEFCRRSPYAHLVLPSKGKGIGPAATPMSDYQRHDGEIHGHHWIISRAQPRKGRKAPKETRRVLADTNYWKSLLHERLAYAVGDPGGLTLFGDPREHLMLAHHVLAEKRTRKVVPGRTVDEWRLPMDKPDNHLFDCLVGSYVGASIEGCKIVVRMRPKGAEEEKRTRGTEETPGVTTAPPGASQPRPRAASVKRPPPRRRKVTYLD
jgi:hypothetical protein